MCYILYIERSFTWSFLGQETFTESFIIKKKKKNQQQFNKFKEIWDWIWYGLFSVGGAWYFYWLVKDFFLFFINLLKHLFFSMLTSGQCCAKSWCCVRAFTIYLLQANHQCILRQRIVLAVLFFSSLLHVLPYLSHQGVATKFSSCQPAHLSLPT